MTWVNCKGPVCAAEKGLHRKGHPGVLQDAGHRGCVLELHAVPAITDAVGGLVHVDTVDQGYTPVTSAWAHQPLESSFHLYASTINSTMLHVCPGY